MWLKPHRMVLRQLSRDTMQRHSCSFSLYHPLSFIIIYQFAVYSGKWLVQTGLRWHGWFQPIDRLNQPRNRKPALPQSERFWCFPGYDSLRAFLKPVWLESGNHESAESEVTCSDSTEQMKVDPKQLCIGTNEKHKEFVGPTWSNSIISYHFYSFPASCIWLVGIRWLDPRRISGWELSKVPGPEHASCCSLFHVVNGAHSGSKMFLSPVRGLDPRRRPVKTSE